MRAPLAQVERVVHASMLSVHDLSRLELAYNSCIGMVLRYFARRNELVRQMFGADTLKEAYDSERAAILAARLQLLVRRREWFGSVTSDISRLPSDAHLADLA